MVHGCGCEWWFEQALTGGVERSLRLSQRAGVALEARETMLELLTHEGLGLHYVEVVCEFGHGGPETLMRDTPVGISDCEDG